MGAFQMQISSVNKNENAHALQGVKPACKEFKFFTEFVKISLLENRSIIG